jgi:hypothetical protein
LSVIIQSDKTIMKDIPLVTGISFRCCYEIIHKLSALGVIEKKIPPSDRRTVVLVVNAQTPHQALQQAGARPSHPDGRQVPHLHWQARRVGELLNR